MYETYKNYSTLSLLNMAEDFRNTVAAFNGSVGVDRQRVAAITEPNSRVLVSANADGVRYNFSSKAVVRLILGEIEDMQTVADEARLRLKFLPHPGMHECLLDDMERESRKCLDLQFGTPKASFSQIMNFARR